MNNQQRDMEELKLAEIKQVTERHYPVEVVDEQPSEVVHLLMESIFWGLYVK